MLEYLKIFDAAQEEPAGKINAEGISFQTVGKINFKAVGDITIETGANDINIVATGDGGTYFNGTVDFSNATVTGLPSSGGNIDTRDLQVYKLSFLNPGNSV